MAKELTPITRQVQTPFVSQPVGGAFSSLGQAFQQISDLAIATGETVGAEYAAKKGVQDAEAGVASKNLLPGFTKVTAAYNKAVINTEARKLVTSGREQMMDALTQFSDPSTFNADTPRQFNAAIQGIQEGLMGLTRDENRNVVADTLDILGIQMNNKMAQAGIDYKNKQMEQSFAHDLDILVKEKRQAVIAGDYDLAQEININLKETISDYAALDQRIADKEYLILQKLNAQDKIDKSIGSYMDAFDEQKESEWMAGFLSGDANYGGNLTFDERQEVAKEILNINRTQRSMSQQNVGEQIAFIHRGISDGDITSYEQIDNFTGISMSEKLGLYTELDRALAAQNKDMNEILQARQNVILGRGGLVDKSTKDKMLENFTREFSAASGRLPTIGEIADSIIGEGPFPMSGYNGIAMDTSIPKFDSMISGQLTSGMPDVMTESAKAWNKIVNIYKKPNGINISADALNVATMFNSVNGGGVTEQDAAVITNNAVLKAGEPEVRERTDRFNNEILWRNGNTGRQDVAERAFKDAFDVKVKDFETDQAFRKFKDIYGAHYIASGSEEAALEATKYTMRNYQKSKYFPEGIYLSAPEKEVKELTETKSFENQFATTLQAVIDRNKENGMDIDWADRSRMENLDDASESDKAFKEYKSYPFKIKVNGLETEVVLLPGPDVNYGAEGEYIYNMFFRDEFGNLEPVPDPARGPYGAAKFQTIPMDQWAPELSDAKKEKEQTEEYKKALKTQILADSERIIKDVTKGMTPKMFNKWINYIYDIMIEGQLTNNPELFKDELERIKTAIDEQKPKPNPAVTTPKDVKDLSKELVSSTASMVGVPEDLALAIVGAESDFKPNAVNAQKNSKSSGLYQFTKGTWSTMVKRYGKEYGITNKDILDPRANAIMGALLTKENINLLKKSLGREPTAAEVYIAHFSGVGKAKRLIKYAQISPNTKSSVVFSDAEIKANPGVIKDTVGETVDELTKRANNHLKRNR